MTSIKDVAARANVSIATVSRIVNNNYPVKQETRQRVLQIMEELNYVPNEVARSLKMDTTRTIGFLVSDISNSFFTRVTKAMEDAMTDRNYSIIVCSTDHRQDRELAYIKMLTSKKVDGLVLNTTGENNEYISRISHSVPTVLIERRITNPDFLGDYISHDNQIAIRLLTTHLIQRNHKEIGIINGHLTISSALERQQVFVSEMSKAGLGCAEEGKYFCYGDFTVEGGYLATERLYSQPNPPTALVIMNNMMTVGALKYFKQHNIRVPEDVSIVNYGDIDNSEIFYVKPTHSTLNADLLGMQATEMLLSRMQEPTLPNRETLLVAQLSAGNTTRQR